LKRLFKVPIKLNLLDESPSLLKQNALNNLQNLVEKLCMDNHKFFFKEIEGV
jgi:hypothetical protein